MCPGFDSRTRRHMWVEFVVGSRPSSEGFSPGSPIFLPPQKSTFLNSNSIGNSRATGLSVEDCYVLPLLNKVNLFIYLFATLWVNYTNNRSSHPQHQVPVKHTLPYQMLRDMAFNENPENKVKLQTALFANSYKTANTSYIHVQLSAV